MTHTNVIFIPATALIWDISGVFDSAFGDGAVDANPTVTIGNLRSGQPSVRDNLFPYGVGFANFTGADMFSFIADYPDDFGAIEIAISGGTYNLTMTSKPGWAWSTIGSGRCHIPEASWNNWPASGFTNALVGHSYTLTAQ